MINTQVIRIITDQIVVTYYAQEARVQMGINIKGLSCFIAMLVLGCKSTNLSELKDDIGYAKAPTHGFIEVSKLKSSDSFAFVRKMANDPDNQWIYSLDSDGVVSIFDAGKNENIYTYKLAEDTTLLSSFKQGKGSYDELVSEVGKPAHIAIGGSGKFRTIALGTDKGRLLLAKWTLSTSSPLSFLLQKEGLGAPVTALDVSPAGDFVVAANRTIRFWVLDLKSATPKTNYTKDVGEGVAKGNLVNDVTILADNTFIVAKDRGLSHWNPASMRDNALYGFGGGPNAKTDQPRAISSLDSMSAGVDKCKRPKSIIAAGDVEGGISIIDVPTLPVRLRPKNTRLSDALSNLNEANKEAEKIDPRFNNPEDYALKDGSGGYAKSNKDCALVFSKGNNAEGQRYLTIKSLIDQRNEREEIPWRIIPSKFIGHSDKVQDIHFDASGTVMITGAADGEIGLWSLKDKEMIRKLKLKNSGSGIEGIGATIAGPKVLFFERGSEEAKIWRIDLMNKPMKISSSPTNAVAFDVSGKKLVTAAADGKVEVYDFKGRIDFQKKYDPVVRHQNPTPIADISFLSTNPDSPEYVAYIDCNGEGGVWETNGSSFRSVMDIGWSEASADAKNLNATKPNHCPSGGPPLASVGVSIDQGAQVYVTYHLGSTKAFAVWDIESKTKLLFTQEPPTVTGNSLERFDWQIAERPTGMGYPSLLWAKNSKQGWISLHAPNWADKFDTKFPTSSTYDAFPVINLGKDGTFVYTYGVAGGPEKFSTKSTVRGVGFARAQNQVTVAQSNGYFRAHAFIGERSSFEFPEQRISSNSALPSPRDIDTQTNGVVAVSSKSGVYLWWGNESYTYQGY